MRESDKLSASVTSPRRRERPFLSFLLAKQPLKLTVQPSDAQPWFRRKGLGHPRAKSISPTTTTGART